MNMMEYICNILQKMINECNAIKVPHHLNKRRILDIQVKTIIFIGMILFLIVSKAK